MKVTALVTVLVLGAFSGASADLGSDTLWLPEKDWGLVVDLSDMASYRKGYQDSLRAMALWADDVEHRFLLQLRMVPIDSTTSSKDWRDHVWDSISAQPIHYRDAMSYEYNGFAFVDYVFTGYEDRVTSDQRNAIAVRVVDNTIVTIRLASVDMRPGDDEVFSYLFGEIKLLDEYQPSCWDYFEAGSWAFREGMYDRAAIYYEKALDIEKQTNQLPYDYWLVLVDNLGMAHGLNGNRERAGEIFRYGISVDPEYPMFFYNLGCVFAEEKKLDSALYYLEQAYRHKHRMITGEVFPDPRVDESFKGFWGNREFQRTVRRLKKQYGE